MGVASESSGCLDLALLTDCRRRLDGAADTTRVGEAQAGQDQQDRGSHEAHDSAYAGDRRDRAERVGVEQQSAQGGALEQRGLLGLQGRIGGIGQRRGAHLGVGLAAGDLTQVHGDKVVGEPRPGRPSSAAVPRTSASLRTALRRSPGCPSAGKRRSSVRRAGCGPDGR